MGSFAIRTRIRAPIEVVFDAARDIDLHVDSMSSTGERAVGGRTGGRIELGESVTFRARHLGMPFTLTSRITAFERPHVFVDEQVSGPFAFFRHEHRFTAVAPGETEMSDDWSHRSPFRPLGWLVDVLVLDRYLRRQLQTRAAAIRRAAE